VLAVLKAQGAALVDITALKDRKIDKAEELVLLTPGDSQVLRAEG
jgi:hypothetical protein